MAISRNYLCQLAMKKWLVSVKGADIEGKIKALLKEHNNDVEKATREFIETCSTIVGDDKGEELVKGWYVQYNRNLRGSFISIRFGWGGQPEHTLSLSDVVRYVRNGKKEFVAQLNLL